MGTKRVTLAELRRVTEGCSDDMEVWMTTYQVDGGDGEQGYIGSSPAITVCQELGVVIVGCHQDLLPVHERERS